MHLFVRHPEVNVDDINKCLSNPDEYYFDTVTRYYILLKKLNSKWICCVVEKLDEECVVATAWYMHDKKKNRYVTRKLACGRWIISV